MLIIYIIIQKISTIGKSPNMIFKSKDELIFKKVKEKTTKLKKNNTIVENEFRFLAENFKLSDNSIKK